jgi:DNA-binding response OmpR family regulator
VARVLVIEDDRKVLRGLERGLQDAGYEVVAASNGEIGYQLAISQPFDCLVLDLMLPGRDGLSLLAELRRKGKTAPVLILTARDAIEDRVLGLDAGGDDYLVKPFGFAELLARIRALLRRGRSDRETILRAGELEMDLLHRRVKRGDLELALTPREYELLEYLTRHKDTIVSRDMLGRDVWKEPAHTFTNVIDVYINFLRRKIDRPEEESLIQTIRGVGYILRG